MNREQLSAVIGSIDDRHVAECFRYAPGEASASRERSQHVKTKRIITLALAAALILSLSVTAYAIKMSVASPEAAQKVALQEIEVWKELGLISPNVSFEGEPFQIVELEEQKGSDYWYGRLFRHSYDVRWSMGPIDWGDQEPPTDMVRQKYGCNLRVDTLTGKITQAFLDARADPDDVPTSSVELNWGDPNGAEPQTQRTLYFYDNFDDLFPADMTVDRFLTLLAEYWGFSGYTLADTVDETYYDAHWSPVSQDSLLKDMPSGNTDNYYLTVFFDGDQEGAPMYLQLHQFPGYVQLQFGIGHAVG